MDMFERKLRKDYLNEMMAVLSDQRYIWSGPMSRSTRLYLRRSLQGKAGYDLKAMRVIVESRRSGTGRSGIRCCSCWVLSGQVGDTDPALSDANMA